MMARNEASDGARHPERVVGERVDLPLVDAGCTAFIAATSPCDEISTAFRSSAISAGDFTTISESSSGSALRTTTDGCAAQNRCTKVRSVLSVSLVR